MSLWKFERFSIWGDILSRYEKSIDAWNKIFSEESAAFPKTKTTGNPGFDKGLEWLTEDASTVLDFGCGNGIVLFLCSLYGTKSHIGIDLSPRAIQSAENSAKLASQGDFRFVCGSLEELHCVETGSVDAVVLSNIIDNLYPEDAVAVLTEIKRILKKNGKILLKLNPYLTSEQIKAWNIRVISGNLLDDGMILWNQTTEEWNDFLSARFQIVHYGDIYYEEHDQYNRLYFLINP